MLRNYEVLWGSRRFSVELDPLKTKDWDDGPQAQCEVLIGHWTAHQDGRVKSRRYALPLCRLIAARVGFTKVAYAGGSIAFRDTGLMPDCPPEMAPNTREMAARGIVNLSPGGFAALPPDPAPEDE